MRFTIFSPSPPLPLVDAEKAGRLSSTGRSA